ncbi:helix-turn-helix domain-containing protein [Candidatus Woesearchaeota archaeon]|nr:helix-turn-helix domain-containing protein [Candidatus Woesearchaeota archaeon]
MEKEYQIIDEEKSINAVQVPKDQAKALGHPVRIRLLTYLCEREAFPKEMARAADVQEQQAYYHLKYLISAGLVVETRRKEVRGTIARAYRAAAPAAFLTWSEKWHTQRAKPHQREILPFFQKASKENCIQVIVGSSDPHGPFKSRARDSYLAAELTHFLGAQNPDSTIRLRLDTEVDQHAQEHSCITIGGPITNTFTSSINALNSAKFSTENFHMIEARKAYTEDEIGLIAKTQHPSDPTKDIITIGGITEKGTRAAILAITKYHKLSLHRYTGQKRFHAIVQGYDTDGDGIIDDIELLE